jgi:hypothetical protein
MADLDIARLLWGYAYFKRVVMLRGLVHFFDSIGIRSQSDLEAWASKADFGMGKLRDVLAVRPLTFRRLWRFAAHADVASSHLNPFTGAKYGCSPR